MEEYVYENDVDGGIETINLNCDEDIVTNFPKEQESLYREAIELYGGKDILYITDEAYSVQGERLDHLSALRCKDNKDLTPFWRIFDKLKMKMQQGES